MFGYVKPDTPYLYIKDDTLYKSLYCSVCKSIGKICGQRARLGLTYDIAFMSAFIHNVAGVDVKIEKKHCIAHPITSRPIAGRDAITDFCACANVALAYYKIEDDIVDGNGGQIKKLFFSKGNKRVEKKHPEISEIIRRRYSELRNLEKVECDSVDMVCEPFSQMMVELGGAALAAINGEKNGENDADNNDGNNADNNDENNGGELVGNDDGQKEKKYNGVEQLMYYLGKWIYLIDALDDYDKDIKEKNYNPFYFCFGKEPDFGSLLKNRGQDVSFVFSSVFSGLKEAFNECEFGFDSALIGNIILRGIPSVTSKTFKKENKKKNGK